MRKAARAFAQYDQHNVIFAIWKEQKPNSLNACFQYFIWLVSVAEHVGVTHPEVYSGV